MSSTKILLVDDDDTYLFLTSKILEHIFSECEITTCLNGQEAIDFLEKGSPDVIFLDINMPVMNGWEFLAELEKKNMDLEYPVFIVTSSIAPNDRERAEKNAFIKGYFDKPLTKEKVDQMSLN